MLEARGEGWRRVEIARGDDLEQLHFVFVTGDDERVRLLTDYDAAGRKGGAVHIAVLDRSLTRVEHWSAPAPTYSGGFCAFVGAAYSYTTAGGFLTPLEPGAPPDVLEPVPVSYQVHAYEGGEWRPAAGGAWSAKRARGESMVCTPAGCVARVPDGSTGSLRWTPATGWVEEPPAPAAADPVQLGLLDGYLVGISEGHVVIELGPGDLWTIPGIAADRCAASGPPLLPPLAYPERASSRVNWS